jgi:predicted nucleic acid-binding protein
VKDSGINYLVDAGPLVAHLDASDMHHKWAKGVLEALGERLVTTETAFAEAAHLLKRHRGALVGLVEAVQSGALLLVPVLAEGAKEVAEKLKKYSGMDLGDATLVVLSEWYPRARLITVDRKDFLVYRRRDGRPVPSLMPDAG